MLPETPIASVIIATAAISLLLIVVLTVLTRLIWHGLQRHLFFAPNLHYRGTRKRGIQHRR